MESLASIALTKDLVGGKDVAFCNGISPINPLVEEIENLWPSETEAEANIFLRLSHGNIQREKKLNAFPLELHTM